MIKHEGLSGFDLPRQKLYRIRVKTLQFVLWSVQNQPCEDYEIVFLTMVKEKFGPYDSNLLY